jgi:hypothetical protein
MATNFTKLEEYIAPPRTRPDPDKSRGLRVNNAGQRDANVMKIDFDHLEQNRPEDAAFQPIELGQHRDLRLREHLDRMRCGIA